MRNTHPQAWGECGCYDNMMHEVAWAKSSFIYWNASFEGTNHVFYEFRQDSEKEIEFLKCSFKLLNVIKIEESNFMAVLGL